MNKTALTKFSHVLLALSFAVAGRSAATAECVTVSVDNRLVSFAGPAPEEINGIVLVPFRGVFQALGATVDYVATTRTLSARKGVNLVTLEIGGHTASVNGVLTAIAQPAPATNGDALIPLRLVAEAIGANVQWNAEKHAVNILTVDRRLAAVSTHWRATPSSSSPVVAGQLTGIYVDAPKQQVAVLANGAETVVPLAANTEVDLSKDGQPAVAADLHALDVGDQVRIGLASDGTAATINAAFGEIVGTLRTVQKQSDGSYIVTLDDGTSTMMSSDATVTMAGRMIELSDIMPSQRVRIRTSGENRVGYGLEVLTEDDEQRSGNAVGQTTVAAPTIYSFHCDVNGPVHAGSVINVSLVGTRGVTALFCIPNVAENIPLIERSPGCYSTSFVVPPNVNVSGAAMVGHLVAGRGTPPALMQAPQLLTIDNRPPMFSSENPAAGSLTTTTRPEIYALIDDGDGTGVDPSSVRLFVDGTDVTRLAAITSHFVTYQPSTPLASGSHTVALTASDLVGNRQYARWSFDALLQPKAIVSFTTDRPHGPILLKPNESLTLRLIAQSGGTAFASLGNVKVPLIEGQTGVYTGQVVAVAGTSVEDVPVTAHYTGLDHANYTINLPQELSIDAGAPPCPRISTPIDGSQVGTSLQVAGMAAPGSTVNVRIEYATKAFGLFAVDGTAVQTQVIADGRGKWCTDNLTLVSPALVANTHNTVFTVSATAKDALGHSSNPDVIKITEQ